MNEREQRDSGEHAGVHRVRRAGLRGRLSRRAAIGVLAGLGAAAVTLVTIEPVERLLGTPARQFPAWVDTMPRARDAYAAAFEHRDLLATLPCYCGCMDFEQPHGSLRTCFELPSGEPDPHGAFCETCQDEALDAAAWARQGVAWDEIHTRIVAKYEDRDPSFGGGGCGGAGAHGAGAACSP